MTTRGKAAGTQGLPDTQTMTPSSDKPAPAAKRAPRADAKLERSSEIFSRLIRSIDSNLSIAHQFAGEAKKRLG